MRRELTAAIIVVGLLCTCNSKTFANDEIRIGGGGAAISAVFAPVSEEFQEDTGITLLMSPSTPLKGLLELEQGLLDISTAAHPLETLVKDASAQGVKINIDSLRQYKVGTNYIMVFLHKSNEVNLLSKEQLKGIFTGKITNWKSLGGEDRSIVVVWGNTTPGQNAKFMHDVMDDEAVVKNALQATDYADIREKVRDTPGAIGIDPHGYTDATIKIPKTPSLSTAIIAVTKGEPSPKVKRLLDYLLKDVFSDP